MGEFDFDRVLDTDSPLEAKLKELDLDDRLLALGAFTNGDVAQELTEAFDYIKRSEGSTDDQEELRQIILPQLAGEIDLVNSLDSSAPADPAVWPRQKAAIERAYYYRAGDDLSGQAEAAIAQAKADTLNNLLKGAKDTIGDAGKGIFSGLEGILSVVVVLVVVLVIAEFARKT
jgi:hypothetical protein